MEKLEAHVPFPPTLELRPFCGGGRPPKHVRDLQPPPPSGGRSSVSYELCGVVEHAGSFKGGHYTAFAKHSESGQWHKFDDSHTGAVEPKDVVTPAAYVLMYGRRGGSKPRASPEF